jgi:hypothetical protein
MFPKSNSKGRNSIQSYSKRISLELPQAESQRHQNKRLLMDVETMKYSLEQDVTALTLQSTEECELILQLRQNIVLRSLAN